MSRMTILQIEIITILANGVIPADEMDRGAAEVNAGPILAARVDSGVHIGVYLQGIEDAVVLAQEKFGSVLSSLNPEQVYLVLMGLKDCTPSFYKQLRADVSALYLSDPGVWQRIGFPGPSAEQGGYPDFDQPQTLFNPIMNREII